VRWETHPTGASMKKLLLIIFTLFTTLWATSVGDGTTQPTNVLPVLVGGEPFDNLDHFYIDGLNVNSVAVSRDGRYIVSGSHDTTIKVWNIEKKELLKTLEGHKSDVISVVISGDGKYIASSSDKSIKIWDREKGILLKTLEKQKYYITSLAINRDGKYILYQVSVIEYMM